MKMICIAVLMLVAITSCSSEKNITESLYSKYISGKSEKRMDNIHSQIFGNHDIENRETLDSAIALDSIAVSLFEKEYLSSSELRDNDSLFEQCINLFNRAIAFRKDYSRSYLHKSDLLKYYLKYDQSIETLEQLLDTVKMQPNALFRIGIIYEFQGNLKKAKQKYLEALNSSMTYFDTVRLNGEGMFYDLGLVVLVDGKEKVLEDIEIMSDRDAEANEIFSHKAYVQKFNRDKFLVNALIKGKFKVKNEDIPSQISKTEDQKEATKLQQEAMELYKEGSMNRDDKDSLYNQAILLMDKAIALDSVEHHMAFKAQCQMGILRYEDAIQTARELLEFNSKWQSMRLMIGILYEKLENPSQAKKEYQLALDAYEEMAKTKKVTVSDISGKAQILILLRGKEKGIEFLREEIKKDPDNMELQQQKNWLEKFDKKEFMRGF